MLRVLAGTAVVVLCWVAEAGVQDAGTDTRLVEAQADFDEAKELLFAGKYADGIPHAEHSLALREAVLGGTHPEVANCLSVLGTLHAKQGHLARAEPLLQRGLSIRKAALGETHPDVADSLIRLADLYDVQGLMGRAESFYQRGLSIREAALGKDHPDIGSSLVALAGFYMLHGWYSRAEPLFQRALAIRVATLGKDNPRVAPALIGLGIIAWDQGLYDRAELLFQRARALYEAALGKDHFLVAAPLNDLAGVYQEQGLYGRAKPLYDRALAIRVAASGKDDPGVADLLDNLGTFYAEQGLYRRAKPLHERALTIFEATYGNNNSFVAQSLTNLANVYSNQGLLQRAEPLHQRALALRESVLGKDHPLVAQSLTRLALLRLAQQRLTEAVPLLRRAFTISEGRLRKEALDFSEKNLTRFLQFLRSDEERLYTLLRAHPDDASVRHLALTAVLLLKGRSADEIAETSRTIYRGLGARDREAFERLRGLRTQLAEMSLNGPGPLAPDDYQQRLKDLAEQGDTLEADLAKRSATLRALTALPAPADIVHRVAAALPRDAALIEFIAYADKPLVPRPGTPESKIPSQLRYLALVLFPDENIRAIDLGPAAPIDSAASRLRDALARQDAGYRGAAQHLHQLAFRPLLPFLRGVDRLFLAPDGYLGQVPFAALYDGRRFLADTFDFTYLTSGKDLLPRLENIPPARSVVILADPDFGAPVAVPSSTPGAASTLAERSYPLERFFSSLRAEVADRPWVPLPGTRQEAETLRRLIPQARLFLGPDATKERLLHLETPGILHIATHGFFLLDHSVTSAGSRGVAALGPLGGGDFSQRPPDPLLRSGLVLAGARAPAAKADDPSARHLDASLVTALELAGVNLWGTQLVVLSACDTGRGDVKLGQGVYGLRRAFIVAGAETLVMSLWKVNDETTSKLMETYYRNLLAGKGRVAALREAMLELRERQPHPHFWAPFIVLGNDAPLQGLAPPAP